MSLMSSSAYKGHYSVLKNEVLALLAPPVPTEPFVALDGTLGEGGHTKAMLDAWPGVCIHGCDIDTTMVGRTQEKLNSYKARITYYTCWCDELLENYKGEKPRVILLDLGLSMFHFLASGRGFSFQDETPLDMRLSHQGVSAAEVVNTWKEKDLADLFYKYGNEKEGYRMACAIVKNRPISTAKQLGDIIYQASQKRHYHIHPATKIFQALRIFVNQELKHLERALVAGFKLLAPGGRFGIISFHSLEDRLVKNYFRDLCKSCRCPASQMICQCTGPLGTLINPGGTVPSAQEVQENAASRSARLRVIQKNKGDA